MQSKQDLKSKSASIAIIGGTGSGVELDNIEDIKVRFQAV